MGSFPNPRKASFAMPDIILAATKRSEHGSRPSGRLRRSGLVPAVVYGLGADPVPVTVPARELGHVLAGESGANTLISLDVEGESILTLTRQIQRHPTRGEFLHVDFVRIRRDTAVTAEIPVHLIGEPIGVKDGGLLEQSLFHLTIEAKPADIPVAIEIDVTELQIGDQLHVSSLPLAAGVVALHEADAVVAQVAAPRTGGALAAGESEAAEQSGPVAAAEGSGEAE